MSRGEVFLVTGLAIVLLSTAAGIAYVQFESRQQFGALQDLHAQRDALQVEWERLLLEQGARAAPSRVERLAREKLSMRSPDVREIQILEAIK